MNLYQDQFSESLDLSATPHAMKPLLIASTPRCGSHMLGHGMADTGVLGVPFEYLNRANMTEWQRRLGGDTPQETLARIMERRTTPNGVFCLKAHFDQCDMLGGAAALFAHLPGLKVVHIRRADVLRQAISYAIARQTGIWIDGQEAILQEPAYDAAMIDVCLNDIAMQNAMWTSAFAAAGIEPLNIFYESTAENLDRDLTAIGRFAGVLGDTETLATEPRTRRQSKSTRTEDWIARYRADRQKRPPPSLTGRIARRVQGVFAS